jgi:hypothetical protein
MKFVQITFILLFTLAMLLATMGCTSIQHSGNGTLQQTIFPSGDNSVTPTQGNANTKWSPRDWPSTLVMMDGNIILIGGRDNKGYISNDVWRSADSGKTWTQITADAGWPPSIGHYFGVMPSGTIAAIGTYNDTKSDIWHSEDMGKTWTQIQSNPGWLSQGGLSSVVLPEGSIVRMGGGRPNIQIPMATISYNTVWRSPDGGATWTLVNTSAGWSPRSGQCSVVMPDGSIVLMGGGDDAESKNDVWRSLDGGTTWTEVTARAGWSPRDGQNCLVMPNGNIIVLGGEGPGDNYNNDVWRSKDGGATWTLINDKRGWSPREGQSSVVMPDGSIVLMGGYDGGDLLNDVYRSTDEGATWTLVSPWVKAHR